MTTMANSRNVTAEYEGRTAIITLSNPKKLNALSQDDYYHLAALLREIATRDDILITLLIGQGRFFSAYVRSGLLHDWFAY